MEPAENLYEAPLRLPEADGTEDLQLLYGEPVETGRNYRTYETPEGTYKTSLPPMPTPITRGGHALGPASFTVSITASFTPSMPSEGFNI